MNGSTFVLVPLLSLAVVLGACGEDRARGANTSGDNSKRVEIVRINAELHAVDGKGKRVDIGVSLEELLRQRMAKADSIRLAVNAGGTPASKGSGPRLRISARLLPDGFSGQLHALISARVTKTGSIPLTADIDAVRDGPADGGTLPIADYVSHLGKALDDVVVALDQQAKLLHAGNESLIKALQHDEADVRVAAARALGERRATDGVEPLCKLLRNEQGQVGQAVIGAMVVIRDERSVPCLIQWAGSEDRRVVLIVEPLAAIGGQESREFLDMIASGHDDALVRRAAEEGLRRLGGAKNANADR